MKSIIGNEFAHQLEINKDSRTYNGYTFDAHIIKLRSLIDLCVAGKRKTVDPDTINDIVNNIINVASTMSDAYKYEY